MQIRSLQYLRALAALLVVSNHAILGVQGLSVSWRSDFGSAGVDIFFVLSGYIIYASQSANRDIGDFAYRRLVRIIPLYWLATAAFIALHLTAGIEPDAKLPLGHVIQSLLLIPHFSAQLPGEIYPVLPPGWTLSYEMFFYGLFALGLVLAPRRLAVFLTGVICALVVLGQVLHLQQAVLATYTKGILLEFVAGVIIAVAAARRTPPRAAGVLVPVGLALIVMSLPGPRVLVWGAPAAMVVYGALALEPFARPRWPVLLGNASYAIYLIQFPLLPLLRSAWLGLGLTPDALLFAAFAIPACALVGVAVHLAVEKPLLAWFKRSAPRTIRFFSAKPAVKAAIRPG